MQGPDAEREPATDPGPERHEQHRRRTPPGAVRRLGVSRAGRVVLQQQRYAEPRSDPLGVLC